MRRRRHTSTRFFFNDTATTEIYTLSLHDALPIYHEAEADQEVPGVERRHERDPVAGDVEHDDPQQPQQHEGDHERGVPARAGLEGPRARRPGLQGALRRRVDRLLAHLGLGHRWTPSGAGPSRPAVTVPQPDRKSVV